MRVGKFFDYFNISDKYNNDKDATVSIVGAEGSQNAGWQGNSQLTPSIRNDYTAPAPTQTYGAPSSGSW